MKRNDGFVLIVTLLIMVVVTILVFGTTFTSMIDRMVSANQRGASAAYYVAQAGLNQYKTLIFKNLGEHYGTSGGNWCASPLEGGIKVGDGQPKLLPGGTPHTVNFGPGSYRIHFDIVDTHMVLTSVGRVGNSQTTLQLVAAAGGGPSGVWDNAIFASGQSPGAKAINGNVAVYGSVHIVNGALQLEQEVIGVSGTAGVYNTYIGKNASGSDIRSNVQAVTGTYDADLCARLKLASGSLYLETDASRIGTLDNPIYSVHLGKGNVYHGKQGTGSVAAIADHSDSTRINLKYPASGKGVNSGYSEAYQLKFPELAVNYPNDRSDALNLPLKIATDPANCGWLLQDVKVQGNNTRLKVKFPPAAPTATSPVCTNGTWSIQWIADSTLPAKGYISINGHINTGVLPLELEGPLQYAGKGAFRVGSGKTDPVITSPLNNEDKSVLIDGSLTPRTAGGYPNPNIMAVVSSGDVMITAGSNDPTIAGVIYSARTIKTDKQTLVIGSMVADQFDVGTNVPKIAWHKDIPAAVEHVALCLPGTRCESGAVPPNPGILSNISLERRDTAAID